MRAVAQAYPALLSWIDREMTRGDDLPISLSQAKKVTQWLKRNYGDKIDAVGKILPRSHAPRNL